MSSGSGPPKITCYTCGEEGHKSPQCTKGIKVEKVVPKETKARPLRRIWKNHPTDVQLSGSVNDQEVPVLLDSGATISVVPESMVTPEQMTGSMVAVKPFGSRKPLLLPTARVPFHISTLDWVEHVAVEEFESEVLYSFESVWMLRSSLTVCKSLLRSRALQSSNLGMVLGVRGATLVLAITRETEAVASQ